MAVVREYKYEGATVRIHDDYLLKDKKEIEKILAEISKIYARAYEREMMEGGVWECLKSTNLTWTKLWEI